MAKRMSEKGAVRVMSKNDALTYRPVLGAANPLGGTGEPDDIAWGAAYQASDQPDGSPVRNR